MMGFGFLWMILILAGLILAAIWVIALVFPTAPQSPAENISNRSTGAREIRDRRYTQGSFTREQYEKRNQTTELEKE